MPDSHAEVLQWIRAKRDRRRMSREQLRRLMDLYARDQVPEYQMAAWTMAAFLNGLDAEETLWLTQAMLESGSRVPHTGSGKPRLDKHSTGGVGDKVSLVLAPLLAACGAEVPMISGRGLGFTGGTLDKLEAVPGLRTELAPEELRRVLLQAGCVIAAQSRELVPADRKLYALRDATATVESLPLIVASILSKKLAEELHALVLDVKWGTGAFMQSLPQARRLARFLVETARRCNLPASALVTSMNQPLGRKAGCSVEVIEAVETLRGQGPPDLVQLVLALGAEALVLAGMEPDPPAARARLQQVLQSGKGYETLARMVKAQGGDLESPLPVAPVNQWCSPHEGYLVRIDTRLLGEVIVRLGGGRTRLGEPIDHSVGLEMRVRLGDRIRRGTPMVRVFAPPERFRQVVPDLERAFRLEPIPPAKVPLVTFVHRQEQVA